MTNLNGPFPLEQIEFRVGAKGKNNTVGLALAYAESRAYMERLDECFGLGNWSCEVEVVDVLRATSQGEQDEITARARLTVTNDGAPVVREAIGTDTDFMSAESRAFKRACTALGIGRYLYSSPQLWGEIKQQGRSYVFTAEAQKKLRQDFERWLGASSKPAPPRKQQPKQETQPQQREEVEFRKDDEDNPFVDDEELWHGELDDEDQAIIAGWNNSPHAAKLWAINMAACENTYEADASMAKIIRNHFDNKFPTPPAPALELFYRRQKHKLEEAA